MNTHTRARTRKAPFVRMYVAARPCDKAIVTRPVLSEVHAGHKAPVRHGGADYGAVSEGLQGGEDQVKTRMAAWRWERGI